jgi:hypothetical protein
MPAIIFTALFWFIIFKMTMNYQGYCSDTGKVMTDDELAAAAIENAEWFVATGADKSKPYIKYKNAKEFLELNPGCCELHVENPEMNWTDKASGSYRAWVEISFLARYHTPDGRITGEKASQFVILGNCGVVD